MRLVGTLALCSFLLGCSADPGEDRAASPSGKELYESRCAMCHSRNGVARAMARGASDLNDPAWQARTPLEGIVQVVTEGRGRMPAWGNKLTEEEIRAIAKHVRTLD